MVYSKPLKKIKKIKYKLIDFDNFSVLANSQEDAPIMSINFKSNDNKLTQSYGESTFHCCRGELLDEIIYPEIANLVGIREVKYFDRSSSKQNIATAKQLYILTYDSTLYSTNLDSGTTTYSKVGNIGNYTNIEILTYFNDSANHLILSVRNGDECKVFICDGYSSIMQEIETSQFIYDICQHNKTIFVALEDSTNVNKVYFGYDLDPTHLSYSISEMNMLDVPVEYGKILKLISLDDLYIICEYGICKVMSYSNQKNHYIERVYSGIYKISKRSIVVCGNDIYFMDESGINSFDGNNVKKIELCMDPMLKKLSPNSVGCFNDGKYYCATRLDYNDGIVDDYGRDNNALIVYDIFSGIVNVCYGMSIYDIFVYKDRFTSRVAIVSEYNDVYKLKTISDSGIYNGKISKKVWVSKNYKSNPNEFKLIKNIYIESNEDIELTINAEGKTYTYNIKGSLSQQRIVVNKKLKMFNLKIVSLTANPCVKNLKVLVGFYE